MELSTLLMLLLSAGIHAVWNFLSKRSIDKQVFLWLALLAVSATFALPTIFWGGAIPPAAWLYIVLSGFLQSLYFIFLGGAYQRGDLSLVYPLARGSAPLVVTVFALLLLGERVQPAGVAGIILVVAGIYVLHLKSIDARGLLLPFASLRERASQFAIVTGFVNGIGTVVDKVGVRNASPPTYLYLSFVAAALFLTPYMLLRKGEAVRREWHVNKWATVVVGLMFSGSYLLVLFALTTTRVSYVSPVREVSVVFGALLGALVLREPFARNKIAGAVLVFLGIVTIGLSH